MNAAAVKERPILFSAAMVRALLYGRKTQTRRIVSASNSTVDGWNTKQSEPFWNSLDFTLAEVRRQASIMVALVGKDKAPEDLHLRTPRPSEESYHRVRCRYEEGDRLWVKNTHWHKPASDLCPERVWDESEVVRSRDHAAQYEDARCDFESIHAFGGFRKRSSIHMPRWASRITLEVVRVNVERVQDITEADAIAEGIERFADGGWYLYDKRVHATRDPRESYRTLWESINGADSWKSNPWVWAIEFKKLENA